MGNFLAEPVTVKDSDKGENDYILFGYSSMQGFRRTMEDQHVTELTVPGHPKMSFFGVFDGHAGDKAAIFAANYLLQNITKQSTFPESIEKAIIDGFMETDEGFREQAQPSFLIDGTTAITALFTSEKVYVANCGDSRCVLSRSGRAIPLSHDHKPENPAERERIEAAGGKVSLNRVKGELAVSRALGDFTYKGNDRKPADEQMVIAKPDVLEQELCDDDEFLILACDGLWDVMSNQEAVNYVREAMKTTTDLSKVCENVLDAAVLELGSKDNVSVVIVALRAAASKLLGSNPVAKPPLPPIRDTFRVQPLVADEDEQNDNESEH